MSADHADEAVLDIFAPRLRINLPLIEALISCAGVAISPSIAALSASDGALVNFRSVTGEPCARHVVARTGNPTYVSSTRADPVDRSHGAERRLCRARRAATRQRAWPDQYRGVASDPNQSGKGGQCSPKRLRGCSMTMSSAKKWRPFPPSSPRRQSLEDRPLTVCRRSRQCAAAPRPAKPWRQQERHARALLDRPRASCDSDGRPRFLSRGHCDR